MQRIKEFDKNTVELFRSSDAHPLLDKWATRIGYAGALFNLIAFTITFYIINYFGDKTFQTQITMAVIGLMALYFFMALVFLAVLEGLLKRLRRLESKMDKGDTI